MSDEQTQLKEIAPGVYEGVSPAKKEVRRFIKLPDDLGKDEMLPAVEAALGQDTSVGDPWKKTVHLNYDLTEKNEVIEGSTYVRYLATADVETLQKRAEAVRERIERVRAEKEPSGEARR